MAALVSSSTGGSGSGSVGNRRGDWSGSAELTSLLLLPELELELELELAASARW
jgi:hypothetical protein